MGTYKEIEGNLITLAQQGNFDVISHGCNCLCTMGAGIAPQMAKAFGCDNFPKERRYGVEIGLDGLEHPIETGNVGDINKLGTIDYQTKTYAGGTSPENIFEFDLTVVNSYTQYHYAKNHKDGVSVPVDYDAITMCMRKMNHIFAGKKIGLPMIGAGLAGGDWNRIKTIIQTEFTKCDVTVVIFKK
jgi:O-acetyl-ADP-ribose deacetylase (regulator of RNase III)